MIRRLFCLFLALGLMLTGLSSAEEDENLTDEEKAYLDLISEEFSGSNTGYFRKMYGVPGKKYEDPVPSDFDASSPALYTGTMFENKSIYPNTELKNNWNSPSEEHPVSKPLFTSTKRVEMDILYVGPAYMIVRYKNHIGYAERSAFIKETVLPVDPVNTPPFNTTVHTFVALAGADCRVRSSMDRTDSNVVFTLEEGTYLSVWKFVDGWAVVDMWKTRGYIDAKELKEIIPISPTEDPPAPEIPISAYTSYYKVPQDMKEKADIKSYTTRVKNIRFGCEQVSITVQPGGTFTDRNTMAPYNEKRYGYVGKLLGGGTCQVSSTLYNAVLALPKLKIVYRHPHGGDGACPYLPCHSDAAVGEEGRLYFEFRNTYDFPIRIEARASDGGALCILIYRAD